jgi:outer membrane lipoprotein-sorting protein
VSATSADGGLTLEFGGTALSLTGLGATASPVQALPALLFGWSGGLLTQYCMDEYGGTQAFYAEYRDGREGMDFTQRVWFDAGRLMPLYAEVYSGETLAMTCEFLTFRLE